MLRSVESKIKFHGIAHKRVLGLAGVSILIGWAFLARTQTTPQRARSSEQALTGKDLFAASCAGCHGLDGMGGERAPNIVTNPQVQKLSETEIASIVSRGVPGTGMPPFQRLGKPAISSVVAYLRDLQGKGQARPLPGDPKRGETIFFGTAQCSTCHMASGRGGFIAPDLSNYAGTHTVEQTKLAITTPAQRNSPKNLVSILTADGSRYEGVVRNEDNFSLQLQSLDGTFHFFSKAEMKAIERTPGSIMPSDYGSKLSETELNDLVSYLLNIAKTHDASKEQREYED